jgi:hypothetical protein
MTDIAELHAQALDATGRIVADIPPGRWHAGTPCQGWDVRALFQAELERHGIATGGWWQKQLDLCLIAIMATFAWGKALGDANELAWWQEQTAAAASHQGIPADG